MLVRFEGQLQELGRERDGGVRIPAMRLSHDLRPANSYPNR